MGGGVQQARATGEVVGQQDGQRLRCGKKSWLLLNETGNRRKVLITKQIQSIT